MSRRGRRVKVIIRPVPLVADVGSDGRPAGREPTGIRLGAKLLFGVGVVIALHVGLVVGWLRFEERSDPERLIEAPLAALAVARVRPYGGRGCGAERRCRDVVLEAAGGRPVRIAISLPAEAGAERLPVVILAGGLRTGREALEHVPDLAATWS